MIYLERTTSENERFRFLVNLLDIELAERDGNDYVFYSQFNKINHLNNCVIACSGENTLSCGAFKRIDKSTVEIKRMYTKEEARKKGIAAKVLAELEQWANELGFSKCILETGKRQPEAIAFYLKNGYSIIDNYGPYVGIDNSICFEKKV